MAGIEADTGLAKEGGDELYQGRVELEIAAPIDFAQMMRLQEWLQATPDLRLVSVEGSAAGDTRIVVFLEKTLPLAIVLQEMPPVRTAVTQGKNILVSLEPVQSATR